MKTTKYFVYRRKQPDRIIIKDEWIERIIDAPLHREIQSDGRMKLWGRIDEEEKYLRVVLLADGETVHNAFFDRSFRGEKT